MTNIPLVVVETVGGRFTFATIENPNGSSEEFQEQSAFLDFLRNNLSGCSCLWQEWRNESLAVDKIVRVSA